MMGRLPKLVEITPEGRIAAALIENPRSYSELKSATGLSDRWLSLKLRGLLSAGLIERHENRYRIKSPREVIDADPVFAQFLRRGASHRAKAGLIAEEIGGIEQVVAVILFGSVAKGGATEESDIDMLVVAEVEMEDSLNNTVYDLMFKYDVPVEAILLTFDDLVINLQAKTAFSFGWLEGYQVLYDRGGVETLLAIKKREIEENWIYDEEAGAWIQRKSTPTLKSPKIS